MPNLDTTYEQALSRHPAEVAEIVKGVRKGKARDKDTDPATWRWCYTWGTRIEGGGSLAELLSEKLEPYHIKLSRMTLDERVTDEVRRSVPVALYGRVPSGRTGGQEALPDFPPEVGALIRSRHEADLKEVARVSALSPEEKEAERREALNYLTGPRNRGFLAFTRPTKAST